MFPFKTALNASTLLPFKLDIRQQVRIAAEAGYEGIEIWMRDVEAYLSNGGTMKELKRHIADSGIPVVNAKSALEVASSGLDTILNTYRL